VLARMRELGARGLWVAAGSGTPAALATIRSALPKRVPVVVTDWYSGFPQLLKFAGVGLDGIYASEPGAPDFWLPAAGRKLVARVGSPLSYTAAYGAGAAEVLLGAIARSDGTRASVARALFGTHVDGILGPVSIDAHGDPVTAPVTIFRIRKGARNNTGIIDNQDALVDRVIVPPPRVIPYSGASGG